MERPRVGQPWHKQKSQKIPKFSDPKRDKKTKNQGSPPRDLHGPKFVPKTSTILHSITKGNFRIYQLERELWLSEVLQMHQSTIKYSFIFIHFLMSENDRNVPLIVCDFQTKWSKRDTLSKEEFPRFHIWNFENDKLTFFNSPGTTKTPRSPRLPAHTNAVPPINPPEQSELRSHPKHPRSHKAPYSRRQNSRNRPRYKEYPNSNYI